MLVAWPQWPGRHAVHHDSCRLLYHFGLSRTRYSTKTEDQQTTVVTLLVFLGKIPERCDAKTWQKEPVLSGSCWYTVLGGGSKTRCVDGVLVPGSCIDENTYMMIVNVYDGGIFSRTALVTFLTALLPNGGPELQASPAWPTVASNNGVFRPITRPITRGVIGG